MALNDRINKIKEYIISFNVVLEEGASYLLVRLPDKWVVPDKNALKENFKVEVGETSEGSHLFATELDNGTDCLFDCVDYVIDFNKNVEARKALFSKKIEELSRLFAEEELPTLMRLEFTFPTEKKEAKKAAATKKTKNASVKKSAPEKTEKPVEVAPKKEEVKKNNNESGLLSLAKTITGE